MYLLIDWGNSQLKYLWVNELTTIEIASERTLINYANSLQDFIAEVLLEQSRLAGNNKIIQSAFIASVKNAKHNHALASELKQLSIPSVFAQSVGKALGIRSIYADPKQLGVDRWLVMIAAFNTTESESSKPIFVSNRSGTGVLDFGTAITLDLLDANGQHLGGQIIPGEQLLLESLLQTDGVVPAKERGSEVLFDQNRVLLGDNTENCVDGGVKTLLSSYLQQIIVTAYEEHNVINWLITGGGGHKWYCALKGLTFNQFEPKFCHSPKLVFNGLAALFHHHIE